LTTFIGCLNGFLHADLHFGNYGVRGDIDNMQIVIYDFGHMYDVRDLSTKTRRNITEAFETFNSNLLLETIMDDEHHIKACLSGFDNKNDNVTFCNNVKHMIKYVLANGVSITKSKFKCLTVGEKTMSSSNLLLEIEQDTDYQYMKQDLKCSHTKYYDTHFAYDDLKILADFAKQLD
jgi:hypothetical protein